MWRGGFDRGMPPAWACMDLGLPRISALLGTNYSYSVANPQPFAFPHVDLPNSPPDPCLSGGGNPGRAPPPPRKIDPARIQESRRLTGGTRMLRQASLSLPLNPPYLGLGPWKLRLQGRMRAAAPANTKWHLHGSWWLSGVIRQAP